MLAPPFMDEPSPDEISSSIRARHTDARNILRADLGSFNDSRAHHRRLFSHFQTLADLYSQSIMVSLKLACALLLAIGNAEASLRSRRLSFESMAGYEPGSVVTDHVSVVPTCFVVGILVI